MVARWQIDARFGHKQTVVNLMDRWDKEFGAQIAFFSHAAMLR